MPRKSDAAPAADPRTGAIDALLALASEKRWSEFGLADIAARAGMTLSELRAQYPSRGAILGAWIRQVDRQVLDGLDADLAGEPARERLFDVLMQRLAVLKPHRAAMATIYADLSRDPLALPALNRLVVNSMQWMLVAAGIGAEGPLGAMRAQGLALAWSRIVRVWLKDEDPGIARTMTEIDRQLRAGERWLERADDVAAMLRPFHKIVRRSRERQERMGEKLRQRFRDFADSGRRSGGDEPPANEAGWS